MHVWFRHVFLANQGGGDRSRILFVSYKLPSMVLGTGKHTIHPGPLTELWEWPLRSLTSIAIAYWLHADLHVASTTCRSSQTFWLLETRFLWVSSCPSGRPTLPALATRSASPSFSAVFLPLHIHQGYVSRTALCPVLGSVLTYNPPTSCSFSRFPTSGDASFLNSVVSCDMAILPNWQDQSLNLTLCHWLSAWVLSDLSYFSCQSLLPLVLLPFPPHWNHNHLPSLSLLSSWLCRALWFRRGSQPSEHMEITTTQAFWGKEKCPSPPSVSSPSPEKHF